MARHRPPKHETFKLGRPWPTADHLRCQYFPAVAFLAAKLALVDAIDELLGTLYGSLSLVSLIVITSTIIIIIAIIISIVIIIVIVIMVIVIIIIIYRLANLQA